MPEPLGQAEQAIREALNLPESLVNFLLSALKEEWMEQKEKEDECLHSFDWDGTCTSCGMTYAEYSA